MKRIQDEFKILTAVIVVVAFLTSPKAFAQAIQGKIGQIGDTLHIEFLGSSQWNYDLRKDEESGDFILVVPPFDELTEVNLRTWSSPQVKKIAIDKSGPDGRYVVRITPVDNKIESFDYLTDEPSRLIVDLYKKEEPPSSNVKNESEEDTGKVAPGTSVPKNLPAKAKGKFSSTYKKIERNPAGGELLENPTSDNGKEFVPDEEHYPKRGVFDGGDPSYSRFLMKDYEVRKEAIIAAEQNIYLKFPMLEVPFKRFEAVFANRPDYEIAPKNTEQNKEARLLVALYEKDRFGSFSKVYDFFKKKYKDTPYDEILVNMAIDFYIKRYLTSKKPEDLYEFQSLLKMSLEKFNRSILNEQNKLLLAYSSLVSRQSTEALRLLADFQNSHPDSKESDYLQLAIAQAYLNLRKDKESLRALTSLETKNIEATRGAEAAFRMGDVPMSFERYDQAEQSYQRAIEKYPEYVKIFPNALYNMAEAQFWQKKHKTSLESFVEFLKVYPSHSYGGYALSRIGELLEILGADKQKVMGAFVEGYFRYPNSPGSDVARVRMLSQGLRSMKPKEKSLALKEIEDIEKRSPLDRMDEFTTLMVSEGISKRQEYQQSLDMLLGYFQANPTRADMKVFRGRILRNISDILKTHVERNQFLEALNFYGKYGRTWLKNSNRIDTEFFKARAYEQAGLLDMAGKQYDMLLAKLKGIKSKKEIDERKVYEHLPSKNQLAIRVAAVALEQKKYRKSFRSLASVSDKELNPEEKFEKAQIGAEVAVATGNTKGAISHLQELIQNWKDDPEKLSMARLRLAQLYLESRDYENCENEIESLELTRKSESGLSDNVWEKTLKLKADYQVRRGRKLAAVQTYSELFDSFRGKIPLASMRYKAGLLLFETGDVRGAEKMWSALEGDSSEFYKKLANEKLANLEWSDSYKKYLSRVPSAQ